MVDVCGVLLPITTIAFARAAPFGQSGATRKHLETMPRLSRRAFLAASAAFAAGPATGARASASGGVDVVIVGAGAAGIAAARRIATAGRTFALLEAADHVGGRCITDTRTFTVPYDRGAHRIHRPGTYPIAGLARPQRIEVYPAPPSQKVRVGRRYARQGELEDFLTLQVSASRAIADAARTADVVCEQVLPDNLDNWRPTVEFILGPFGCAKDLTQVSAVDFANSAKRDTDTFCRQGFGTLLAALAEGIAVHLSTPVITVDTRRGVAVETPKGTIAARTAIVTVSTNMVAADSIKFIPDLSARQRDAFGKLALGSYDHVAFEFGGNALGLDSDDLVFEKATSTHTAAILANVSGTSLSLIEVAGQFGRDLSAQGEAAMVDFAANWLAGLYGADVKKAIKRSHATRWNHDRWTLGAFSAAAPGGQGARRILMEPVRDAVWFAGEAVHETLWGTVGGAWVSGERAAEAVLRRLSGEKELGSARIEKKAKRRSRHHRAPRRGRPPFGAAKRFQP